MVTLFALDLEGVAKTMEWCFVPSDAVENSRILSAYGEIVEMFVRSDYCTAKGGCFPYISQFPGPSTDFFDYDTGWHRCTSLSEFLRLHHPAVGPTLRAQCLLHKKGFRFPVPDIITYQPPLRTEYYEIKPDSAAGKRDGRDKMNWFDVICQDYGLPYVRGSQYLPNAKVLVWDGTWFGSPSKVHLRWSLVESGLLAYKLCIEVNSQTIDEWVAKTLIRAIVLGAILLLKNPGAAMGAGAAAARLLLSSVGSPLEGSVGPNAANIANDVWYVQALLNDWRGRHGLSLIGLTGSFNEETRQAIIGFQNAVTGVVNGRIDVNEPAIHALEEAHVVHALVEDVRVPPMVLVDMAIPRETVGYDFHGEPEEPIADVGQEEMIDPEQDLQPLAQMGLKDYLEYLYF